MTVEELQNFKTDYNQADMLLIGIGGELHKNVLTSDMEDVIKDVSKYLDKKNYFIITSNTDQYIEEFELNRKRFVQPMLLNRDVSKEIHDIEEKQWDLYNKWLAGTLNKKLLMIELGEGFNNPNLFRWPFEKVALINQKAKLYRINEIFAQIPKEIEQKAVSLNQNSVDFLKQLSK